ncbi:unnamed protein product [Miscanthus lutarioriparius]|uniref:Uncharacterized protein n=1 Tax=Miscanthus lutarioriparius TaxID=422564 RepID=A0A811RU29_9POAL|nr:unnamed protein product [Miscanthus lutarioriparius]
MSPQEERFEFDWVQTVTGSQRRNRRRSEKQVSRSVRQSSEGKGCLPGAAAARSDGSALWVPAAEESGGGSSGRLWLRDADACGSARAGGRGSGPVGGGEMDRRRRGARRVRHGRGLAHGTAEEEAGRAGECGERRAEEEDYKEEMNDGTEQHGGGRGRVVWCRARWRDFGSFRGAPCKSARNQSGRNEGI